MIEDRRDRKVSLTEERELNAREKKAVETYIKGLPVPRKIELASRGNREVRAILARDPIGMVAKAVIAGARITDEEVISYAQSSNVNEEVLKHIAENSQMIKNKSVLVALCNNPRTPVGTVVRFLPRLDLRDLKNIARSRNVAAVVRTQAKMVLNLKQK